VKTTSRKETQLTGAVAAQRTCRLARAINIALIAVVGLAFLFSLAFGRSGDEQIYFAQAGILVVCLFALASWWWIRRTVLDPYILFLGATTAFNGGGAILQALGLDDSAGTLSHFSPETRLATVFLVLLSLLSLHFGALTAIRSGRRRCGPTNDSECQAERLLRATGWVLILVGVVPFSMISYQAIQIADASGYIGLYAAEQQTSFSAAPAVLAAAFVPGTLFLTASAGRRLRRAWVPSLLTLIYICVQLVLGYRSSATLSLAAYMFAFHRSVRAIPKFASIAIGCLLVAVVFPTIAVTRGSTGSDRQSMGALYRAFSSVDNPAVAAVGEMGGTAQTIAYTMDLVPTTRPFDMGTSYLYGALTALPNLFWDVHPSLVHNPSRWLITTVNPYIAQRFGSLGYSAFAEAYLNFGWFGAVIVPALLGYCLGRLTLWAEGGSSARVACASAILFFSLKYARSDITEVVRGVVWYSAVPYFMVIAAQRRGSHRARAGPERNRFPGVWARLGREAAP